MKPFDLEKALAGEPVKLRNGYKAYIKYNLEGEPCFDSNFPLQGYFINNGVVIFSWSLKGEATSIVGNDLDIVGMWEEPRPRVQLDLPCPLKTAQIGQTVYYQIGKEVCSSKFGYDSFVDIVLELGGAFATKEDCQEWINASQQSRR